MDEFPEVTFRVGTAADLKAKVLAEKEWRSTFRRRAKIMESALGAAASLDAPTPETDEEP